MLTSGVILAFALIAMYVLDQTERSLTPLSNKVSQRLQKLWEIASSGMREQKYLRAEKALLTILKLDQTNAAAYNRLGILYSRQKEYRDAIECFEIASSIMPTASSLHNLGLIYYETENYEKAATAFESALKLEDDLAARHLAYAKVLERLGETRQMMLSLQRAAELEPNAQTMKLLAGAYRANGLDDDAKQIERKASKLTLPAGPPKRLRRPKRVIY